MQIQLIRNATLRMIYGNRHWSGASFEPGTSIIMDGQLTIEVCRPAPQSTVIAIHMESILIPFHAMTHGL